MLYCHIHPDRETGRSCTRCGLPACPACLHDAAVGAHCTSCVIAARGPASQQLKRKVRTVTTTLFPATKVLIALNAVVFVLSQAKLQAFDNAHLGIAAFFIERGDWWRIVTSGFAHVNLIHIGFNMYALYALGQAMERQLGSARFLGVYGVSLLGGSLGAILFEPNALAVGASGAVFGLFGAMAMAMRQRGMSVMKSPLGPTLLINFVLTFAIPGIAIGGHIGGFIFGGLAGGALLNPRKLSDTKKQDAAVLAGLAVLAVVLTLYFAKHGVNGGRGLWPRNS